MAALVAKARVKEPARALELVIKHAEETKLSFGGLAALLRQHLGVEEAGSMSGTSS